MNLTLTLEISQKIKSLNLNFVFKKIIYHKKSQIEKKWKQGFKQTKKMVPFGATV